MSQMTEQDKKKILLVLCTAKVDFDLSVVNARRSVCEIDAGLKGTEILRYYSLKYN